MRNVVSMCLLLALVALSPQAQACDTLAWSFSQGDPQSDDPDTNPANNSSGTDLGAFRRYSGACGMRPASGAISYVGDDSPAGETSYRTRFYVYTGAPAAETTVFRAFPDNGAAGTPVFEVRYNPAAATWSVWSGGSSRLSVPSVAANRWYTMEIVYAQNQPLTLITRTQGVKTTTSTATSLTGLIHSVALGSFTAVGNTASMYFDSFASSRQPADLGALCRGDANKDNNLNVFDTVVATNERVNGVLAAGQPDCNEDGNINIFDTACIVSRRISSASCGIDG
jgi:hypothetical protein